MKVFVLIIALTLIGCGSLIAPPFEEPVTGPTAKIRLFQVSGESTSLATFSERENCTGALVVFDKISGTTEYKSIYADKEFAFYINAWPTKLSNCQYTGVFTPREGSFYNMQINFISDFCQISMFRNLTEVGGKEINVPITKLEHTIPFDVSGSFCK